MKSKSITRRVATRRTSVPRRAATGSFGGMLARLGFASEQLKSARRRSR